MSEHFRRIDPRYDRHLSVEVAVAGKDQIGRSLNVSLGGMFLECREAMPVGAVVNLRFKVPTQPEMIEVAGDVRWVVPNPSADTFGVGVRFQGLRARDVWALNRFFQSND